MLQGYRLYDADAHAMMSPRMWETLPKQYFGRRPRPTHVADASDMGRWTNGWLVEGQIIPHAIGPGSQPGNEPARVLEEFGASSSNVDFPLSGFDLSDPSARLRGLDYMGIDHQMLYPTTLYARMTFRPRFRSGALSFLQPLHGPTVQVGFEAIEVGRAAPVTRCKTGV